MILLLIIVIIVICFVVLMTIDNFQVDSITNFQKIKSLDNQYRFAIDGKSYTGHFSEDYIDIVNNDTEELVRCYVQNIYSCSVVRRKSSKQNGIYVLNTISGNIRITTHNSTHILDLGKRKKPRGN